MFLSAVILIYGVIIIQGNTLKQSQQMFGDLDSRLFLIHYRWSGSRH